MPCQTDRSYDTQELRKLQDEVDKLTRWLCMILGTGVYNQEMYWEPQEEPWREIKEWWEEHKEVDRKRIEAEKKKEEREERRKELIESLSEEDLDILGVWKRD